MTPRSLLQRLRKGIGDFARPLRIGAIGLVAALVVTLHHNTSIRHIPRAAAAITAVAIDEFDVATASADGEIEVRLRDGDYPRRLDNSDGAVTSMAFVSVGSSQAIMIATALGAVRRVEVSPLSKADPAPASSSTTPAKVAFDGVAKMYVAAGTSAPGKLKLWFSSRGARAGIATYSLGPVDDLLQAQFQADGGPAPRRVVDLAAVPTGDPNRALFRVTARMTDGSDKTIFLEAIASESADGGSEWRAAANPAPSDFAGDFFKGADFSDALAFHPSSNRDGNATFLSRQGELHLTRFRNQQAWAASGQLDFPVTAAAFDGDTIIVGDIDGRVRLVGDQWTEKTGYPTRAVYRVGRGAITHIAVRGDTVVVGNEDGSAAILKTGPLLGGVYAGLPAWWEMLSRNVAANWRELMNEASPAAEPEPVGEPGPGPVLVAIGREQPRNAVAGGSAIVLLSSQRDMVGFLPAFCAQAAASFGAESKVNGGEVSRPIFWPVTTSSENTPIDIESCDQYVATYDFNRARAIRDKFRIPDTGGVDIVVSDAAERALGAVRIEASVAGQPIQPLLNLVRARLRCRASAWEGARECPAAPTTQGEAFTIALVEAALTQVGVEEQGGANRGPQVDQYWRAVGAEAPSQGGWSAAFVTWAAQQASAAVKIDNPLPRTARFSDMWTNADARQGALRKVERGGLNGRDAPPGSIFLLERGPSTFHGGVVLRQDGERLVTIEAIRAAGQARDKVNLLTSRRMNDPRMRGAIVFTPEGAPPITLPANLQALATAALADTCSAYASFVQQYPTAFINVVQNATERLKCPGAIAGPAVTAQDMRRFDIDGADSPLETYRPFASLLTDELGASGFDTPLRVAYFFAFAGAIDAAGKNLPWENDSEQDTSILELRQVLAQLRKAGFTNAADRDDPARALRAAQSDAIVARFGRVDGAEFAKSVARAKTIWPAERKLAFGTPRPIRNATNVLPTGSPDPAINLDNAVAALQAQNQSPILDANALQTKLRAVEDALAVIERPRQTQSLPTERALQARYTEAANAIATAKRLIALAGPAQRIATEQREKEFAARNRRGGLSTVRAEPGVLTLFAAQPGAVVEDGPLGGNSPFTAAFADQLRASGANSPGDLARGLASNPRFSGGSKPWFADQTQTRACLGECVKGVSGQAAGKRIAVVIGNGAYAFMQDLPNPANDAALVAKELRNLGYDVRSLTNASRIDILAQVRALRDEIRKERGDARVIFYYSGQGVEIDGVNYIFPVDARAESVADVTSTGISFIELYDLLRPLDPSSGFTMMVFDACRNNPFNADAR